MVTALTLALVLTGWPGDEMPLPVTVRDPQDLQFKAAAEKQYLIFNLMVSGRLAYERGDWATAAEKLEALLRVPELPASVDAAVRPLAIVSRQKAGGTPVSASGPAPAPEPPKVAPTTG